AAEDIFAVAPEVIPVRGVDDVLVPQLRIRALQLRDHVPGPDLARGAGRAERGRAAERDRPEVTPRRGGLEGVEVLARGREQLPRPGFRDPRLDLDPARVPARRRDVEVLPAPAPDHDLPRVAGRPGLVDDD